MAGEFRISVEIGHLLPATAPLTRETFPALSFAVQRIAEAAQSQWASYASGEPMPNGKVVQNRTGEYLRSILLRQVGDFSAEVFSDLPYARAIEEGSPARDLKKMLSSSLKVRLTKDGRRYLIIPFRWNKPGSVLGHSMPKSVWAWWQRSDRGDSWIKDTYARPSGTGAFDRKTRKRIMVPGWRYDWGNRLHRDELADLPVGGKMAKRLEGMVRFRQPGASGGASHGKYLTFRVMVEGSPGWLVPAQEGKWPAKQTSDLLAPVAEQAFRRAMEDDIAALMPGSVDVPGGS